MGVGSAGLDSTQGYVGLDRTEVKAENRDDSSFHDCEINDIIQDIGDLFLESTKNEDVGVLPASINDDDSHEAITINQLRSSSMLKVPVCVEGIKLEAVVDTAAQVTLISDQVYHRFKDKPPVIKNISLNTAGRQMKLPGAIIGPVKLKLGKVQYLEKVYVAPIEDEMLLGLDFLQKHQVNINLPQAVLQLPSEIIPMSMANSNKTRIARVTVDSKTVIPPNTVKLVKCSTDSRLTQFMVEPKTNLHALVARTVHLGPALKLCVVNPSDRNVVLKRKQVVGRAYEGVEIIEPDDDENSDIVNVCRVTSTDHTTNGQVPEHLQDLVDRSKEHLDDTEHKQLTKLLLEYQDVFASNDYDLGNFTAIEHNIETGDARPIKQKMRRTPICFADEETANLEKMLKAQVIEPSTSDWAASPVLVRKRDGTVRWCVDYRGLNSVTVKDVFPLPLIEECIDTLSGNTLFSKLDANSAYWQIKINPSDRKKTAFATKFGLFEFIRMGFGLCNAPATYCRIMNLVLRGLNWKTLLAFLDDILVLGKN
ncbi:MAG: reverse transcriptase family protein, partial [Sedimenticola sp.]